MYWYVFVCFFHFQVHSPVCFVCFLPLNHFILQERVDRLCDFVNSTKDSNLLFAFLNRQFEGRALRAVGPPTEFVDDKTTVITLSGLVAEAVDPPRWAPDEVLPVSLQSTTDIRSLVGV